MNREDKITKRIARAKAHRAKRMEKYVSKIRQVSNYGRSIPLSAISRWGITNSWADPNSPTGYSQICSYQGICQSPCNGDC